MGMVTNWSSNAGDLLVIPGCELVVHVPVFSPDAVMFDFMVPFKSKPAGGRGGGSVGSQWGVSG